MTSPVDHDTIRMLIPAVSKYVSVARSTAAALAERLGFEKERIGEIISAVGEACVNTVQHAYKNGLGYYTGTDIDIQFLVYPTRLTIVVRDLGVGVDPAFVQRYVSLSDAEKPHRVRMGLFIIKQMMDELEIYSDIGRGTQVRMTKYLLPEDN